MQIGVNNEVLTTDGVSLAEVLRPGTPVGHPLLNFDNLETLTRKYIEG